MKRSIIYPLIVLFAFFAYAARPALAQSETPPAGPTGEVSGTIINRNAGTAVTNILDIMLHILDQNSADAGMLHGQSQSDGTFLFTDVPFDANSQYAVMAIFDGVTYFSETTPVDRISMRVSVEVPVYEFTSDLRDVQVDQMHVLFDFAEDGLEMKEIYIFSNSGERTVKNVYDLGNDPLSGTSQFATLEFPLPEDADYILFKPEDKDRFAKLSSGFADTYPILPGAESSQIMVSYLVPYSGKRTYTYTAPLNIARINFLVPDQVDISLEGTDLTGPETMDLQNGASYLVYSYSDLNAGETVKVSISGKLAGKRATQNAGTPIAVGAAFVGFAVIGAGIWWWRRPDEIDEEAEDGPEAEVDFDQTINEIAQLDQAREKGDIDEQEYRHTRELLRKRAKALLDQNSQEL